MLLGTLGASLLANLLTVQALYRTDQGLYRIGQGLKKQKLMPFHPLTNFEIIDYFEDVKSFNGVYSKNNLPKLKNGAYFINLDHSENTGTHWAVVFVMGDEVIYFDSFGVEYIPKEIMEKIKNKNIKTIIFRIQDSNSIMCGYFCILFLEYMLKGKTLTDYTNLFSPWDLKKNDKIIKSYFKSLNVKHYLKQ